MLKVTTYNIHYGRKERSLLETITQLKNQGTDVFCFQEVREGSIAEKISKILGPNWKSEKFVHPGPLESIGLGLYIFWRADKLQFIRSQKINLPLLKKITFTDWIFQKFGRASVKYGSGWNIFIRKTDRPAAFPRGALSVIFNYNGGKIRITDAHLDYGGGIKQRVLQFKYLNDTLTQEDNVSQELICGDFNTVGTLRKAKQQIVEMLKEVGTEFTDTLEKGVPTLVFHQRCDYILQKGFNNFSAAVFKSKASDHKPVSCSFEL